VRIDEHRTRVGGHIIFSRSATAYAPAGAPTVVLVHGYVASSDYMLPTMRTLAPYARVHALDLPGWGQSDASCAGLMLAGLADILVTWMDERGLEAPVLLGNSLGCQIVAEAAVRYPDSLSCAIFIGPTIDPGAHTAARQAWRLALDVPRERPSLWLVELLDLWKMGPRCALRVLKIMLDDHIEEKLPHIQVPVLILRGSRDPICPQAWAERAVEFLPHGELAVLPGAGHAANYSAPRQVVAAALDFVKRHIEPKR
jgi:2-hydroxy-6-oxonona-2,4-dienedioate hydrolase